MQKGLFLFFTKLTIIQILFANKIEGVIIAAEILPK